MTREAHNDDQAIVGGGGASPTERDVLCGSGRKVMNHRGNQEFRTMVKNYYSSSAGRGHRAGLVGESIVDEILQRRGRFLKRMQHQDDDCYYWSILSRKEAIEKTAQAIRDAHPSKNTGILNPTSDIVVESNRGERVSPHPTTASRHHIPPTHSIDTTVSVVKTPTAMDVLCGSGRGVMNHPGNQEFRALVKANACQYNANRQNNLGGHIVAWITDSGGRFLKPINTTVETQQQQQSQQYWKVLTRAEALKKTQYAIRDAARALKGVAPTATTTTTPTLASAPQRDVFVPPRGQPTRDTDNSFDPTPLTAMMDAMSISLTPSDVECLLSSSGAATTTTTTTTTTMSMDDLFHLLSSGGGTNMMSSETPSDLASLLSVGPTTSRRSSYDYY